SRGRRHDGSDAGMSPGENGGPPGEGDAGRPRAAHREPHESDRAGCRRAGVSVAHGSLSPMDIAATSLLVFGALVVGALLGWLGHAQRVAPALRENDLETARLRARAESAAQQ